MNWGLLRILYRLALLEEHMSELDDAVTRISTDVDAAVAAIAELRTEIANLGSTGADVTALTAAADKLEGALAPPTPPTP